MFFDGEPLISMPVPEKCTFEKCFLSFERLNPRGPTGLNIYVSYGSNLFKISMAIAG